jgi:hypothetical protein
MNQSIDYVGKLIRFPRKNWFHELRRRIECFESQVFLIKCIKVIGRKENLGDFFINKRKQLFEEIDDLTGSIWFILMFGYRKIWTSKKCNALKKWRTSYLCCSCRSVEGFSREKQVPERNVSAK